MMQRSHRRTYGGSPPTASCRSSARSPRVRCETRSLFILPAALILSAVAPVLVEIILMVGGTYLCFEGAEKVHHRFGHHGGDEAEELPAVVQGPEAEAKTIAGAIRTDFILSAEIMVIALKEVLDESIVRRAIILVDRRACDHRGRSTAQSRSS